MFKKLKDNIFTIAFIAFIAASLVLPGIGIKTVKGVWKSDILGKGNQCTLIINDDCFSFVNISSDSICLFRANGTWVADDSCITFYIEKTGETTFNIKQLSQDKMTIESQQNRLLILNRQYNHPESSPLEKYFEVATMKGDWLNLFLITIIGIAGMYVFAKFMQEIYDLIPTIIGLFKK